MTMETKTAPWGNAEPPQKPEITVELRWFLDQGLIVRLHRDAQGKIWVRFFKWRDQPPGYWAADEPRRLSEEERLALLAQLDK